MVKEFKTPDLEQERRQFERNMEQNEHKLHESLSNTVDKAVQLKERGGKTYLFGVEVDPRLGSLVRAGVDFFTPHITKLGAPTVGRWFRAASTALPASAHINPDTADKIGQAAFLWSTVFVNQITDLASHSTEFRDRRNLLHKAFKPLADATGANISTNEVMRTEYDRASSDFWASNKAMAADLVTLAPKIMIAKEQHDKMIGRISKPVASAKISASKEHPINTALREKMESLPSDYFEDFSQEEIAHWKKEAKDEISRRYLGEGKKGDQAATADSSKSDLLTLGSVLSPFINDYVKQKQVDKTPTAWEMIDKKLRQEIEGACNHKGADCEFSPPSPSDIRVDGRKLTDYIVEIVQQNEKNRGRCEIAGVNLERLHDAAQLVAESLCKGIIDVDSLVVLVGEQKIVKHAKAGETKIADEDTLKDSIEKLSTKIGRKIDLSADEFFKAFTNKDEMVALIRKDMEELKGVEKACFMALLPDEVLKEMKLSEKDIRAARVQARDHMYGIVEKYMQSLHTVIENSSREELRDLGLTRKSVSRIKHLLSAMESGHKDQALQSVVDGHHREILALMATVMLNEQKEQPAGFAREWTEFVQSTPRQHKNAMDSVGSTAQENAEQQEHDGAEHEGKSFASKASKRTLQRKETSHGAGVGAGL